MYRLDTFILHITHFSLAKIVLSRYYIGMEKTEVYDYLERLTNLMRTATRDSGTSAGLQPVQLEALYYLSRCNRYSDTPMAVVDYLGQTKGTVSQTLKVLERKLLIEKQDDAQDKRLVHLKVTQQGWQCLQQQIPNPQLIQACESLSDAEQQLVVVAVKTLLIAFQRTNQLKSFGVCQTCCHNQKLAKEQNFCQRFQETLATNSEQLICREHA